MLQSLVALQEAAAKARDFMRDCRRESGKGPTDAEASLHLALAYSGKFNDDVPQDVAQKMLTDREHLTQLLLAGTVSVLTIGGVHTVNVDFDSRSDADAFFEELLGGENK
jgi:hypothetical protein